MKTSIDATSKNNDDIIESVKQNSINIVKEVTQSNDSILSALTQYSEIIKSNRADLRPPVAGAGTGSSTAYATEDAANSDVNDANLNLDMLN